MPRKKRYGYEVVIHRECEDTSPENQQDEEFPEWSSECENTLQSVSKTKEYPDIVSTLDIQPGQTAYVVWAEWSYGDSFGQGYCNATEALAIFLDEESAKDAADWYRDFKTDFSRGLFSPRKQKHRTPDGQELQLAEAPWEGYFEKLEGIRITEIVVSD